MERDGPTKCLSIRRVSLSVQSDQARVQEVPAFQAHPVRCGLQFGRSDAKPQPERPGRYRGGKRDAEGGFAFHSSETELLNKKLETDKFSKSKCSTSTASRTRRTSC